MPTITSSAVLEAPRPDNILIEDAALPRGFVQLPKVVLYARHLSRDAKLLYAVLLGYAWQEQRCFPGYQRLCADLEASENAVRKWMRELEAAHLISQRRRGQGRTNIYIFRNLRTAHIEVQDHHQSAAVEPQESEDNEEAVEKERERERTIRSSNFEWDSSVKRSISKRAALPTLLCFFDCKRSDLEFFSRKKHRRIHRCSVTLHRAQKGGKRKGTWRAEKENRPSSSISSQSQ